MSAAQRNGNYADIHREAFLFDSHVDTVGKLLYKRTGEYDFGALHIDVKTLRQGNFGGLFFAAFIMPDDPQPVWRAFSILELAKKIAAKHPKILKIVASRSDLRAARREHRIAAMLSLENGGDAINGNLDLIDTYADTGVRCFGIVWNDPNCLAVGTGTPRSKKGLTRMGKEAVPILNNRGVIVDVSHLNEAGFRDVMRLTRAPVIASHSNAHALHPVPRNLKDWQIKALADTGGVIGVNLYPPFLTDQTICTIAHVADHIEYIAEVAGIDHVGIGTDFDGIDAVPDGLDHAGRMPRLTRELVRRGISRVQIHKILGGNHLRVINQIIP